MVYRLSRVHALTLIALMAPFALLSAAAAEQPIKEGDRVTVMSQTAAIKVADKTLTTVTAGTELVALKTQGNWVMVRVRESGKEISGWIHIRDLRRAPREREAKATKDTPAYPPGKEGWKTKKISFDFVDTPFPRVIEKLRELAGMNITLHASVKQADGRTVTLRVNEIRAEGALNWLCVLMGVTWYAKGDTILVGTQEAIEAVGGLPPRIRREYDLTSVLDAKQQNDEAAGDEWVRLLKDKSYAAWDKGLPSGRPQQWGTIEYRAGKLIVVHTEEVQKRVKELIHSKIWERIESDWSELEKRRSRERPVRPRAVPPSLDPIAARTLQAEAAKRIGKPVHTSVAIGAAVKLDLVLVPPGTFLMGSESEKSIPPEIPVHEVRIAKPFYMGKYEVTQEQWQAVMGFNPSSPVGAKNPVDQVNWESCQVFLRKLNEMTGRRFSLPSEAEWEYACRAGSTTLFCFGDDEKSLGDYAWHGGNSNMQSHPVGQKKPNSWGLFDMHGNVYEWCEDLWHSTYDGAPADGAPWLKGGYLDVRVLRGGGWRSEGGLDSASRSPSFQDTLIVERQGLRVVLRDF